MDKVRAYPRKSFIAGLMILFFGLTGATRSLFASSTATQPEKNIVEYIHGAWQTLKRSSNDCSSLSDSKLESKQEPLLYVPKGALLESDLQALRRGCNVKVEVLPRIIARMGDLAPEALRKPGLLYLPHPYVVPGGRFNEMYGWDSYFIIRGLVEDGEIDLARGMVENFFFEIENYGAVLNANRTYYLTRSQPPFLTSMILAVHDADRNAGRDDRSWLLRAYSFAQRDYAQWTSAPKLAGHTGLSRYFDVGSGPVPEIADHPEYYATVADWLVRHPQAGTEYFARSSHSGTGPKIRVPRCGMAPCAKSRTIRFTADYYQGDRAMRESGFDISFRFGPFGGSTHHFAPVCLNSLLYKTEKDLETMARLLDRPKEAIRWRQLADRRKRLVSRLLWNQSLGIFTDFDFYRARASTYSYATTFYPLWAGLATNAQARAVMKNLKIFEQPGGLATSARETGVQWDQPYGWAPIQMLAVEGMRRYGFQADAARVTKAFLSMVEENFLRDGTIREKYNALKRSTEVDISAGYASNVVGFGWTNGTFVVLLHQLPSEDQKSLSPHP